MAWLLLTGRPLFGGDTSDEQVLSPCELEVSRMQLAASKVPWALAAQYCSWKRRSPAREVHAFYKDSRGAPSQSHGGLNMRKCMQGFIVMDKPRSRCACA